LASDLRRIRVYPRFPPSSTFHCRGYSTGGSTFYCRKFHSHDATQYNSTLSPVQLTLAAVKTFLSSAWSAATVKSDMIRSLKRTQSIRCVSSYCRVLGSVLISQPLFQCHSLWSSKLRTREHSFGCLRQLCSCSPCEPRGCGCECDAYFRTMMIYFYQRFIS
jgi:hypothetical protein